MNIFGDKKCSQRNKKCIFFTHIFRLDKNQIYSVSYSPLFINSVQFNWICERVGRSHITSSVCIHLLFIIVNVHSPLSLYKILESNPIWIFNAVYTCTLVYTTPFAQCPITHSYSPITTLSPFLSELDSDGSFVTDMSSFNGRALKGFHLKTTHLLFIQALPV